MRKNNEEQRNSKTRNNEAPEQARQVTFKNDNTLVDIVESSSSSFEDEASEHYQRNSKLREEKKV
jgi:hypothetical protein